MHVASAGLPQDPVMYKDWQNDVGQNDVET
jgi:hypothetical protein